MPQKKRPSQAPQFETWRAGLHEIIFEADTPAGKVFDFLLIASILLSVIAVMLDSVVSIRASHDTILLRAEWFFHSPLHH